MTPASQLEGQSARQTGKMAVNRAGGISTPRRRNIASSGRAASKSRSYDAPLATFAPVRRDKRRRDSPRAGHSGGERSWMDELSLMGIRSGKPGWMTMGASNKKGWAGPNTEVLVGGPARPMSVRSKL